MHNYFRALVSNWVTAVSALASIAALVVGFVDGSHGTPKWVWFLIGIAAFVFSSFRIWSKEHGRAEYLKSLLLNEYIAAVKQVRGGRHLVPGSEEQEYKFYRDKIEADDELLKEAIAIVNRNRKPPSGS